MENGDFLVKNLVSAFNARLSELYSREEIGQIIYMVFEEYLGWSRTKVHLSYNEQLPESSIPLLTNVLHELGTGNPVQYILGKAWFNGNWFHVDNRVLIPRPETAELCAMIATNLPGNQVNGFSILDIGMGSGCIAIDLKKRLPQAVVTGLDFSDSALDVARANARENGCDIELVRADILSERDQANFGMFNLIVSNPPYVTENEKNQMSRHVKDFEPSLALFVPDRDPLQFYHAIAAFSKAHLTRRGLLYFEINERFGAEIRDHLLGLGFTNVEIFQDIHGKDRFIRAVSESPSSPHR